MKASIIKRVLLSVILTAATSLQLVAQPKAMDITLEGYQYPFPVQYIQLQIQGEDLKMAYMDVKPTGAGNGHTVLLLHGKNFTSAYWRETAKALSENGFRVIMPDQIGFGKSSKPQKIQYTFQLLAQNTRAVLDKLGVSKVCVMGHSMGGMLATRFTLMYPEMVEKFILEDPIGLEDWKLKVPYQTVDQWYANELKQTTESLKKYEQDNYYHGNWRVAYDEWLEPQAGWTLNPDYKRIAWNSALTYDMIFTQPVCYEFDRIKAPALIIIGQMDKTAIGKNLVSDEFKATLGNYPQLGKLTHDKIKGSKLVELEGIGHIPHIEAFDRFIKPLLEFLKE